MKKNVLLVIASAVAFSLLFALFSTRFKSPENAMVPPRQSEENQEILQAFQSSIGRATNYQLKYPRAGKYRNAFTFTDLDGDGTNEVIVFYSAGTTETTRMNVLDRQEGKWVSVLDSEGYGMDVYSVDFDDLNGDKNSEAIISWVVLPNTQNRNLTVLEFEIDQKSHLKMRPLLEQQYRYMGIADMDGDSHDELLVIWANNGDDVSQVYASLFKMDKDSAVHAYGKRAALDNGVSGYSSLKFQKTKDRTVAFLDAYKGEHGMITEIIWWDKDKDSLVAPLSDNDALTNTETYRPSRIPSRDISGDSTIEIPLLTGSAETSGGDLKSNETQVPLVCWHSVKISGDTVRLVPQDYTLVNLNEQYILRIQPNMIHSLLAVRDSSGVATVYESRGGKRGEPLFSIVIKPKSSVSKTETYSFRVDHGNSVAFGTLTNVGSRKGFTNDSLEQALLFY